MGQITGSVTSATIVNADIAASAGIEASKLVTQRTVSTDFGLSAAGTPTTQTRTIFVARSTCTVRDVIANLTDTGTSTNIDFDVHKNGVSILSADINFVHGDTDNTPKAGTVITSALVSGDILTAVCTVTSSTGALGPFVQVHLNGAYV